MYRKKLMKACLTGALVISLAASNVAPFAPAAGTTVEAAETNGVATVVFVDRDGNNLGGGDLFVAVDEWGMFNYTQLEERGYLPEGYKLAVTGDGSVNWDNEVVCEKKTDTITVNICFVDAAGNFIGGGDYWVTPDENGHVNYSDLEVPEGYETTMSGDLAVEEGKSYEVTVVKKAITINVVYVDAAGNNIGGGDYWVTPDVNGNIKYSDLEVPEGYETTMSGDLAVEAGGSYEVTVVKKAITINVVYVDAADNNIGGGDYWVTPDVNGNIKYSDLEVPEGYETTLVGDLAVEDGGSYVVEVVKKAIIINVVYVDAAGNNIGGGDYWVTPDVNGHIKYSDLEVPEGYETTLVGDLAVEEGKSYEVTVKKTEREAQFTVTFETADGTVVDRKTMLKAGADGTDVTFELGTDFEIPEGYQLAEGVEQMTSFSIPAGAMGGNEIVVEKVQGYAYIEYVDAQGGYTVAYGVAQLDENGVFNTSSLQDVPEGYELTTVGDFSAAEANEAGNVVLKVQKIEQKYVYIQYVDAQGGYTVAYGVAQLNKDGYFNTGDLQDVPEGYELVTVGDFTPNADGSDVVLKVQKTEAEYAYIQYVDAEGGYIVAYGVAQLNEDGYFNTGDLKDVPEGYELTTVGDFTPNADGSDVVLKVQKIKEKQEYAYIQYVDAEGGYIVAYGVAKLNEYGYFNTGDLQDVPGDFTPNADGSDVVLKVRKVQPEYVYIEYVDAQGGYTVAYGVAQLDENGIFNTSSLQDVPEGYELTTVGDFSAADVNEAGNVVLKVQKIQQEYTYVQYVDAEGGYTVAYGVAWLNEYGYFNTGDLQDVPEGYELVTVGDFTPNADGSDVILKVQKVKEKQEYAYIQYVDAEGGYIVAYGVAKLNEYGYFNTGDLQDVPEGYELTTVGDFTPNADGSDVVLKVQKIKEKQEYAYIQYVDAEGGYIVAYGVAKLNEYGYFNTGDLQDVPLCAGYSWRLHTERRRI